MAKNSSKEASDQTTTGNVNFTIQKIYTKDLSFESPKAPNVFTWARDQNTLQLLGT